MELRHLRYFTAVVELGTFTAAGRRLHVSQSAISEQMADLEAEVGGRLLERTGRRVRLTPQGEVFLEEARKTLAAADRTLDLTQRSLRGEVGTLSVGFFLWGSAGFFPRIIRDFRRSRPGIRLSLFEMRAQEQAEALVDGRLDVGLTRPLESPFDRTLRSEFLYRDPIVLAMRRDHPLAGKDVKWKELAHEPLVVCERRMTPVLFDSIVSMCAAAGFSPRIVNTSETWSGVLTLVEANEGMALVPAGVRYLHSQGVVFRKLVPDSLSLGLAVAWHPRNKTPALQDFLALLREHRGRIEASGGQ